jgi:4'-phosphopantetheinyl transferase
VVSRAALRCLLGQELNESPASVIIRYGAHGKPELQESDSSLQFNLAHSGDWAVIALARGRRVGIDVEQIRPGVAESLAQRFFSPREAAAVLQAPPQERDETFFRCWTRKEAYLKALGCGLSLALDSFEVSLAGGEPAGVLWSADDPQAARRWSMWELQPGPGYLGALVLEAEL